MKKEIEQRGKRTPELVKRWYGREGSWWVFLDREGVSQTKVAMNNVGE